MPGTTLLGARLRRPRRIMVVMNPHAPGRRPARNRPARTRVAMIALSTALLASPIAAPAVAHAAPGVIATASSSPTAPDREIGLAGTQNTRTLGGYVGTGGRTVNDRVLRSDSLSKLTAADVEKLTQRGLKTVVDLRTDIEKRVQPNKRVSGVETVDADVLGKVSPVALVDLDQAYRAFVTDANARAQIRAAIVAIKDTAADGGTTLFHCSAGKDRTGWTAAVLLTILGVDRSTIDADYLASNHYRHADATGPLNGVNIGWLNASFAAAQKKFGSMDGYLTDGLKLTDRDIASLRENLLN
ncbi:tyrosine-protein phosphatase [Gordonia sp. HY002]|uniref:tyrosine-protein phosphatase n=1 Tax=Gordonia zhenghanii TaxID=2911516 RepID=UPI001EF0AE21|nr:tyrosine-protein phosphatase [Gordonia zhenghanii]MCF8569611.1 tyrosine-protein phosphatase [Gordonia zhenghanii]MCF8602868.1 tyrosine-protein phosphatase [Gordonia zhenghanii]